MNNKSLTKMLEKELGPISFGGFLRAARKNKDMTQIEMAKYLKISKSTLSDIENGRQIVSIELAARIAKRCQLSIPLAIEVAVRDHLKRLKLLLDVKILEVV